MAPRELSRGAPAQLWTAAEAAGADRHTMEVLGTGDVLAGTIAGLLARGLDAWDAACVGVHVHGLAGQRCMPNGSVAMDVADALAPTLAQAGAPGGALPSSWPQLMRG